MWLKIEIEASKKREKKQKFQKRRLFQIKSRPFGNWNHSFGIGNKEHTILVKYFSELSSFFHNFFFFSFEKLSYLRCYKILIHI